MSRDPAGLVFSNNFGNILPGSIATVVVHQRRRPGRLADQYLDGFHRSTETNMVNNSATLVLAVTHPEPVIVANGAKLLAESLVPPNGAINSNETVTVAFTLENTGVAATTNLTATLLSGNGVQPITASQNYGAIIPGGIGGGKLFLHGTRRSRFDHHGGSVADGQCLIPWERFHSHLRLRLH